MDRGSEKGCFSCFLRRVVYPRHGRQYVSEIYPVRAGADGAYSVDPVFSLMNEGADPGKWLDETVLKEKKGEMEQWIFQMQKKS